MRAHARPARLPRAPARQRARRGGCSASASPCSPSAPATAPRRSRSARWRSRPATTPRSCAWTRRAPCCCRSAPPATARATRRRSPRSPPTGSASTPDRVEVRQGDTDATPYGWGTFASRSMVVGGGATRRASDLLAERLKPLAAHMLEADPEDLELRDGEAVVRGAPGKSVAFAGDRAARLPRDPQAARGRRARPRVHRELRPARHVLQRLPRRDRRARPRDDGRADRALRRRRGLRRDGQPGDRRGPGARRRRPGHRGGALRGARLRRRTASSRTPR